MNHTLAMDKVALAYLFGDFVVQNVTKAHEIFEKMASMGLAQGQRVGIDSQHFYYAGINC